MDAARRLGDRLNLTIAEQALAATHLAAGDARRHTGCGMAPWERSARCATSGGISRRLLGTVHLEGGDALRAVTELEGSVAMLRGIGQRYPLAHSLSLLARAQATPGSTPTPKTRIQLSLTRIRHGRAGLRPDGAAGGARTYTGRSWAPRGKPARPGESRP